MRKPKAKAAVQVAAANDVNTATTDNGELAPLAAGGQELNELPQAALPAESEAEENKGPTAAAIAVVENDNIELVGSSPWGEAGLDFLRPAISPAPILPMDKLPAAFSELVSAFIDARKLVPDYVAFSILGAVSGALGNRVRIGLPDGTTETMSSYVVLVGEASTGKGRAIKVVEEPLRALDDEMCGNDGAGTAAGRAAVKEALEQIQTKVTRRLAIDYEKLMADVTESASASLLVTEATGPGLLDELCSDQNGRMLLSHEITGSLGYLMSSQASRSQGILLTAFDGGPYTGRSKTGGKIRIPAMVLTVLGATQPRKLPALLRGADDGFAARVFWIYPNAVATAAFGSEPGPVEMLHRILSRLISIEPVGRPPPSSGTKTSGATFAPGSMPSISTSMASPTKPISATSCRPSPLSSARTAPPGAGSISPPN